MLRYQKRPDRNVKLRRELQKLSRANPRDGYRSLYRQLRWNGWNVNKKRIERLYREEKLTLRRKRKRKLPVHLRGSVPSPTRPNDCWSIDFLSDAEASGRHIRVLALIDDATRESLLLQVAYSMTGAEVADAVDRVATFRGYPAFLRSDNGPEFRSNAMASWAAKHGVTLLFIEPGKPFQNCFIESFNGKFRDRCLDLHVFENVSHAQATIDGFRHEYNHERPHGSLGVPPAVFARELRKQIKENPRTKPPRVANGGG